MNKLGASFLAAQHKKFPVDLAMQTFEGIKNPTLAFLYSSFGLSEDFLKVFMQTFPSATLMPYFSNEVARRKRMYRGEFMRFTNVMNYNAKLSSMSKGTEVRIIRRLDKIQNMIAKYMVNHITILNIALEDQFVTTGARNINRVFSSHLNPFLTVKGIARNSIFQSWGSAGADFIERHDLDFHIQRDIFVPDGYRVIGSGSHSNLQTMTRNQLIEGLVKFQYGLVWWPDAQGLKGDSGSAAPPRRRKIEITREQVRFFNAALLEAQKIGEGVEPKPVPGPKRIPLVPGGLWKPEADAHSRLPGKLVVIFPPEYGKKFRKVVVARRSGTPEVLSWSDFGNPLGGRDRQHWRGMLPGINYEDNAIIEVTDDEGKQLSFYIEGRSSERHG